MVQQIHKANQRVDTLSSPCLFRNAHKGFTGWCPEPPSPSGPRARSVPVSRGIRSSMRKDPTLYGHATQLDNLPGLCCDQGDRTALSYHDLIPDSELPESTGSVLPYLRLCMNRGGEPPITGGMRVQGWRQKVPESSLCGGRKPNLDIRTICLFSFPMSL